MVAIFSNSALRQRPPAPVARPDKLDLRHKYDPTRADRLRALFNQRASDREMMEAICYTSIGSLRHALDKLGLRARQRKGPR